MNTKPITKEVVAQAVIAQIEKNDKQVSIETGLFNSYKNPVKVIWKTDKTGYTPDIKTVRPEGNTNIYEIELTGQYNEEKWRLFSLFVKSKNGDLVLVVPESSMEKVKAKIKDSRLRNIQLLYIPIEQC